MLRGVARRPKVLAQRPVTPERKKILSSYEAELVLTDPLDGSDGAIREARRIHAATLDRYFYAGHYTNDANWRAHYDTTGPAILEQTGGRVTHFVAGTREGVIVTIFCDSGERYLAERFWDEPTAS